MHTDLVTIKERIMNIATPSSKRALGYLVNSFFKNSHNNYVACFSSTSRKVQGGKIPINLGEGDPTVEVPGRVSGLSNVDNMGRASSKGSRQLKSGEEKREEMKREKMKTEGAGRDAAEMAKAATVGAMETGLMFGEMAKQTVDGMWDAARKTAESVRDSVADDGNQRRRHQPPPTGNEQDADKHVEDLRRRAGGYDLKDR